MKALVFRHFNDIVSLIVLTLMAMALIAGQVEAAAGSAELVGQGPAAGTQVILEVRSQ